MSTSLVDHLLSLLLDHTSGLEGVGRKKMFGCEAFFRDGAIFALVWKEGRIAVKLTDAALNSELAALDGTAPWSPGATKMGNWLLVPESFHDDDEVLETWVRRAWACAALAPPKKSPKSTAKKKASPRATKR